VALEAFVDHVEGRDGRQGTRSGLSAGSGARPRRKEQARSRLRRPFGSGPG
jgi:hypothetical protein